MAGRWRGGEEALPGLQKNAWLADSLIVMVAVAVAAEEQDAGNEDEGAEDGGEDGCVDV